MIMKKLLIKKNKGNGDMIASILTLFALFIFTMVFMWNIVDTYARLQVDQVARKYILRIESEGTLTDTDLESCIAELKKIGAVSQVPEDKKVISVKATSGKTVLTSSTTAGYGNPIRLEISATIKVHGFDTTASGSIFGNFKSRITTCSVVKESTAKY